MKEKRKKEENKRQEKREENKRKHEVEKKENERKRGREKVRQSCKSEQEREIWVKHVQFSNTLYNFGDGENTLILSNGQTLNEPPGFYIPAEFVALLQTLFFSTGVLLARAHIYTYINTVA